MIARYECIQTDLNEFKSIQTSTTRYGDILSYVRDSEFIHSIRVQSVIEIFYPYNYQITTVYFSVDQLVEHQTHKRLFRIDEEVSQLPDVHR